MSLVAIRVTEHVRHHCPRFSKYALQYIEQSITDHPNDVSSSRDTAPSSCRLMREQFASPGARRSSEHHAGTERARRQRFRTRLRCAGVTP